MTDRSDPKAPKSSRKKPAREPATIDLKATVIDDGIRKEEVREDPLRPEETIMPEPEQKAQDTVASPEATLDSGRGTDSIRPGASTQEPPAQAAPGQDTLGSDTLGPETSGSGSAIPPRDGDGRNPPARRTSTAALIGSGLLGGLVGAGLVYGAQALMAPDAQDDQRIVQLEQRLSALGQRGLEQGDLQGVQGRIQSLENAGASLEQRLQAIQSTAEQAAARAEEALNRPLPQTPAPETNQALDEAFNRLSALESQVQSRAQEAANTTQTVQNTANAVQALQQQVSSLESRLSGQDQRIAELGNQLEQRFGTLSTQLDQQIQNLGSQLNQQVQDVSAQLTQRNQGAQSTTQAGIRVVLTERLSDALNNGNPYPDVLEGLRKFEADPSRLAPLEPFAQTGAPTAAALAQSFESLATTIRRESRGPANGWSDRVLRMMDRVVTVRPVNEPDASGVPGLVARIEQALERGDIAAAAQAWQALPEPARQLSTEWGQQVVAVAQAHQASKAIADNALAALNNTAQ